MKTSARNQFKGIVTSVHAGATNDTIVIEAADGQKIVASITRESTNNLDLREGSEVVALIKASSIILVSEAEKMRFSARNQFSGSVTRVQHGAVNTEVVMTTGSNSSLAMIVTNDSADRLELKEGSRVTALFKASSVIVGKVS